MIFGALHMHICICMFMYEYAVLTVRNKDLTWPEELCQLAKNKALIDKSQTGFVTSHY